MKKYKSLFQIFLPLIGGTIIGILITPFINDNTLTKPPLFPPNFLFPIVWTILYLLIGISYFLVKQKDENCKLISFIYYLQLILNFSWPICFFVLHFYHITIIISILLLLTSLLMTWLFHFKSKLASYLLIPYILWLIYALYLNVSIVILN